MLASTDASIRAAGRKTGYIFAFAGVELALTAALVATDASWHRNESHDHDHGGGSSSNGSDDDQRLVCWVVFAITLLTLRLMLIPCATNPSKRPNPTPDPSSRQSPAAGGIDASDVATGAATGAATDAATDAAADVATGAATDVATGAATDVATDAASIMVDVEHISERYSLLSLIMLGEVVLGCCSWDMPISLPWQVAVMFIAALAIVFLMYLITFTLYPSGFKQGFELNSSRQVWSGHVHAQHHPTGHPTQPPHRPTALFPALLPALLYPILPYLTIPTLGLV